MCLPGACFAAGCAARVDKPRGAVPPGGVATDPGTDLGRLEPYLGEIREACEIEDEAPVLVCAIGLRETHFTWAPGYAPKGSIHGRGDRGHGFGPYQFDDRGPYAHLPREAPHATVYLQTRWVCWALADARRELVAELGSAFARQPLFDVATVCCFNAGSPAVARCIRAGRHPDHATADGPDADHEGDYGSSVLAIRDRIRVGVQALLAGPLPLAQVPPASIVNPRGEPA